MKKIILNYSPAILLYSVIIIGVLGLNARFKYLNEIDMKGDSSVIVATNK